jgi:hypothetical protein
MSDDEYSEDDDASYKVRRAAAKCLVALFGNYPDLLPTLYPSAFPALVARFREREESVKMDVFSAFSALVQQVRPAGQQQARRPVCGLECPNRQLPASHGDRRAAGRSQRASS